MIPYYLIGLSLTLFALGVVSIVSTRRLHVAAASIAIILVSASILAASSFTYLFAPTGAIPLLFAIWASGAAIAMVLVALHRRFEES